MKILWGSRFKKKLEGDALSFSSSLSFDIRLYKFDIIVSTAHAKMLEHIGILNSDELKIISDGLQKVENEIASEEWTPDINEFEDIHSAIENRLTFHIGEIGGKLHSGRSRNDQIATDIRLWQKDAILQLKE